MNILGVVVCQCMRHLIVTVLSMNLMGSLSHEGKLVDEQTVWVGTTCLENTMYLKQQYIEVKMQTVTGNSCIILSSNWESFPLAYN